MELALDKVPLRVEVLFLATVLGVLALFVLANRTFLLSDTFRVKAEFYDAGGLLPGAPVQYQGIGVGRVYTPSAGRRPRGARRAGRSPQHRRRRPDRTPRFQRVGRLRSGRRVQLRILVRRKHTLGVSCHQPRQHAT